MLVILLARIGQCIFLHNNSYCPEEIIGDGICDVGCMVSTNNFDSTETPSTPFTLKTSDCLRNCLNSGCTKDLLENSICDPACNSIICGWDGGKCGFCSSGCFKSQLTNNGADEVCNTTYCFYDNNQYGWCAPGCFYEDLESGVYNPYCNVTECGYQNGAALYDYVSSKCNQLLLENDYCDDECNSEEFEYDNGKCLCDTGCYPEILKNGKCELGNPCLTKKCNYMQGKCEMCIDGCLNNNIGDGECQDACNVEECEYDGGDCGCAPGCNSTYSNSDWDMQGGCDLYCLVPSCLFNYKDCNDTQLISIAIMYSMVYKNYNEKMDESYLEEIKNFSDIGTYTSDDYCYTENYLYCNGIANFFEYGCLRNANYVCILYNYTEYVSFGGLIYKSSHPVLDFLTTVDELNNIMGGIIYFIKEGSFSKNSPSILTLGSNLTLDLALRFSIAPYNHIKIPEGDYEYYKKFNTSVYSTEEINENYLTDLVLESPKFLIKIEGIGETKPFVYFYGPNEIYTEYNIHIKNVYFSGRHLVKYKINDVEYFYCPYLIYYNDTISYTDRDEFADYELISEYDCSDYSGSNTFNFEANAYIEDVVFHNFQQQSDSLIVAKGNLKIVNSVFEKIQTYISIIFAQYTESEFDLTITLINVQIIDLNYGYEHIDLMSQCSFLTAYDPYQIDLINVSFEYNMAITCAECSDSPLINVADLSGTLNILDCTFRNMYIRSILKLSNSMIAISDLLEKIDVYGTITYYSLVHLLINNSVFENIYAQDALFIIEMGTILQNQKISNCRFENLHLGDKGFLYLTGSKVASDSDNKGSWVNVNSKRQRKKLYFHLRYFEFANCEMKNIGMKTRLMNINMAANTFIKNVTIDTVNELSVDDIFIKVINKFQAAGKYLSISPKHSLIEPSKILSIIYIANEYSAKIEDLSIKSVFSTSETFSIILLSLLSNNLTIDNINVSDIKADSNKGIVLDADSVEKVFMNEITFENLKNKQQGLVKLMMSDIVSITNVSLKDCEMLFSPAFYIQYTSNITLCDFDVSNLISYDSKGTLFNVLFGSEPEICEISRINMRDSNNSNGKGLVLYIDGSSSINQAKLYIEDIDIRNSYVENSFIYIEFNINLQESSLNNISVIDSRSLSYGIITDFHNKGVLEINNFVVTNHNGACGIFAKYLKGEKFLTVNNTVIQNSICLDAIFSLEATKNEMISFSNLTIYETSVESYVFSIKNLNINVVELSFINLKANKLVLALNSKIDLNLCIFTNIEGSGYFLMGSSLLCFDCIFKAFTNSIVKCLQDSYYEIKNSEFTDFESINVIISNDATYKPSSLINCKFLNNYSKKELISTDGTNLQITGCLFKNNTSDYDYQIGVSSSNLIVNNSKFINNPPTFISGTFGSNIILESSEFYQNSSSIDGIGSNLTTNKEIFNEIIPKLYGGVAYLSESDIKVTNCIFQELYNGNGAAIYSKSGVVEVTDSDFINCSNTQLNSATIYVEARSLVVKNSNFLSSFTESSFIRAEYSDVEISGSSFRDNSNDFGAGLFLQGFKNGKSKAIIDNCFFYNNKVSDNGGGIYSTDMMLDIIDTAFELNRADEQGGGLYFEIVECLDCNLAFYGNSSFISNSSPNGSGGAIKWLGSPPNVIGDIFYLNNSALYGSDNAAYPVNLKFDSRRELLAIENFRPGAVFKDSLIICLTDDYDNVVSSSEYDQTVGVLTGYEYFVVSEKISFIAISGCFNLTGFILEGPLGQNGTIIFHSDLITEELSKYGYSSQSNQSFISININLRECSYGEQISKKQCVFCSQLKYLIEPSESCLDCPTGAKCLGGYLELPTQGYWKLDRYSSEIYQCPYADSCLGSKNLSDNIDISSLNIEDDDVDYTGTCLTGYKGNMCASCEIGYSKSGNGKCAKCPNPSVNAVIIASFMLLIIMIAYIMVSSTLKSAFSAKSLHSIYIKIFTNYLQIVFLTTELNLNWPNYVLQFFSIQRSAASSTDQLYSIDCFFGEKSNFKTEDIYYYKILLAALLPFAVGLISLVVWLFISFYKESNSYLKRELWTTIIVLFFLVHPNVVKTIFSSFSCKEIKRSGFWLNENLDIKCWSVSHSKTVKIISTPSVIIWGFGVPLFVLIVMIKRFKFLGKDENKVIFGFLYNGFKRRKFFWEFFILYRKLLIICISVFMATSSTAIQALTVIILLVIALYFQYSQHPYTTKHLNYMEIEALLTSTLTIYCGLYYIAQGLSIYIKVGLFVLILLGNLYFILYWLYFMMKAVMEILIGIFPRLKILLKKGDFINRPLFEQNLQAQGVIFDKSEGEKKFTFFKKDFCKLEKKLQGIEDMNGLFLATLQSGAVSRISINEK